MTELDKRIKLEVLVTRREALVRGNYSEADIWQVEHDMEKLLEPEPGPEKTVYYLPYITDRHLRWISPVAYKTLSAASEAANELRRVSYPCCDLEFEEITLDD